ncbi:MAG: glutamine--tRNA ligase/YqeY domain fusion protein [Gammaproteobacteria bacterium]|nr:glutamine--tRNA ligase/YqeY domain fusion protein [Gammaproteobacteria bacterium]
MSDDLRDFIRNRIRADVAAERLPHGVVTRFPPEPNGYLHIGHAKSICLNFGVAEEFDGRTFLRFDDTNPLKEGEEFVEAIRRDVEWLGFRWTGEPTFASDYFRELYHFAERLIERGKAYVCSLTAEEIRASRGTLTEPGTPSPYRDRPTDESLDLFRRMKAGEFPDGAHVLRARIDPASPNVNMRDPVLYRIRHATHHRTGDDWCIYPMYDFTHCICDALEGISHSLCTLEFEDHRPLYDWVLDNIDMNYHPPQIEFSRLGLPFTVMSKRQLTRLVADGHVSGWDDPRMPTLAGLRRRGYRPEAIREFCRRIGVSKADNLVEVEFLEFCVRNDLEGTAPRAMAVLDPLPVTLTNYHGDGETLTGPWHPQRAEMGQRDLAFSRNLYIEREDFSDNPPRKYRRLVPGGMVRLRYGYIIECEEVVRDSAGEVSELRCRYVPESKSGSDTSGLKPKGVIHWVDANSAIAAEVRNFDRLFRVPAPAGDNLAGDLNPNSLHTDHGFIEPAIAASPETRFQFERTGYFVKDSELHHPQRPVFNRIVSLRDSWKPKAQGQG